MVKLNKTQSREIPRQRWIVWLDRVKGDLNQVEETESMEGTDNRDRWKNLVEAAKDLNGL